MSHAPLRKEKDCLNCGTTVQGRFCHHCGQENVVTRESFGKLVLHFFYDITHFDSKFFDTLRFLLFRPGFLALEYMKGRRASYLNPIRMYVFTSAFFFLIFFALKGTNEAFKFTDDEPFTRTERDSILMAERENLEKNPGNFNIQRRIAILSDTLQEVHPTQLYAYSDGFMAFGTINGNYRNRAHYDSVQANSEKKDSWLAGLWNKRAIEVNEKYKNDPSKSMERISDSILHKLPYILFVSLPFFALILKLLYIRRKNLYYADHGIFSVYHYILSFILLLFVFLWDKLAEITNWRIWTFMIAVTIIALPVYLFISMKRFYRQGGMKTFFKFLLLNIIGLVILFVLLAIFFLFSVFQI